MLPLDNILVDKNFQPVFKAFPTPLLTDKEVKQGSVFDAGTVNAHDADNPKLAHINILENNVDTGKIGTYQVSVEGVDR